MGIDVVKSTRSLLGLIYIFHYENYYCTGHTMAIFFSFFIIREYTPRRLWYLHGAVLVLAITGIVFLLLGKLYTIFLVTQLVVSRVLLVRTLPPPHSLFFFFLDHKGGGLVVQSKTRESHFEFRLMRSLAARFPVGFWLGYQPNTISFLKTLKQFILKAQIISMHVNLKKN